MARHADQSVSGRSRFALGRARHGIEAHFHVRGVWLLRSDCLNAVAGDLELQREVSHSGYWPDPWFRLSAVVEFVRASCQPV